MNLEGYDIPALRPSSQVFTSSANLLDGKENNNNNRTPTGVRNDKNGTKFNSTKIMSSKRNASPTLPPTYSSSPTTSSGSLIRHSNNLSQQSTPPARSSIPALPRTTPITNKDVNSGKDTSRIAGNRTPILQKYESFESLFCLSSSSSKELYQLCRSVAYGKDVDNLNTLNRILDMVISEQTHAKDRVSKEALIKLHRRVTLRFPLQKSSWYTNNKQKMEILHLWMKFARIYAYTGKFEDARSTFHHIENNYKSYFDLSLEDAGHSPRGLATFYLSYAKFEAETMHDRNRAREILLRGIEEKVEPVEKLKNALKSIDNINNANAKRRPPSDSPKASNHAQSKLRDGLSSSTTNHPSNPSKRLLPGKENESSPKRQKFSSNLITQSSKRPVCFKEENSKSPIGNPSQNTNIKGDKGKADSNGSSVAEKALDAKIEKKSCLSPALVTNSDNTKAANLPPLHSKKRTSFNSKLSRIGLSGKAERVNASQTTHDSETSDDDEGDVDKIESKEKTKKVKLDISYILDWDPNATGKKGNQDKSISSEKGKFNNPLNANESTESSVGSNVSNDTDDSSTAAKIKEQETRMRKENCSKTQATLHSHTQENPTINSSSSDGATTEKKLQSASSQGNYDNDIMGKFSREFLPMILQENVLRINGKPYLQMKKIGKGQSCSVYRALDQRKHEYAVKKVKLEGVNDEKIKGYANEISLLKELRSKSGIIELYDSEIDLQRRSIYLVLELGSSDLSGFLRKKALENKDISLKMHTVRTLWEQMLLAVNTIHEHKIIHTDLKPANFLIVKGEVKLIDFGIAKTVRQDDTTRITLDSAAGTLNYMSPEQFLDIGGGVNGARHKIGRPTDVWSLGCILYEMVYGMPPYARISSMILKMKAICDGLEIKYGPAEPAAIDAMKQCLRKEPKERAPIIGKNGLYNEHWFLHSCNGLRNDREVSPNDRLDGPCERSPKSKRS